MAGEKTIRTKDGRVTRNLSAREARAAAKVKVATDKKLGRKTEKWVTALAGKPHQA